MKPLICFCWFPLSDHHWSAAKNVVLPLWCQMRWALESTCIVLACAFANGLELLCPSFILQWAGIPPPMFHFAMGWNSSAHVLSWISPSIFLSQWSGCRHHAAGLKSTRERDEEIWLFLLTPALCFHVRGSWRGSSQASPSSIVAADDDYLDHSLRLRRGGILECGRQHRKHVIMGSCHAMHVMVGSWVCNESCNWAYGCHVMEHVMEWCWM